MSGTAADRHHDEAARARRAAQERFDSPLVVEAGAGTGKTSILVARIVAWLLGPGWEAAARALADGSTDEAIAARAVGGVVGITFTDAAAAEMASRVGRALTEVAAGTVPQGMDSDLLPAVDLRRARGRELLNQAHRLRLRTIHSFCQRLLQRFPLEARLDPGFRVDADETAARAAAREVVEGAMRQGLGDPPDPRWLRLAGWGQGPPELEAAVVNLLRAGIREQDLAPDPYPRERIAAIGAELAGAASRLAALERGRLQAVRRGRITQATTRLLAELARELAAAGAVSAERLADLAHRFSPDSFERLGRWADDDLNKSETAVLGDDVAAFSEAAAELAAPLAICRELYPRELADAREVVADLLARVRERMRSLGRVSFQDLLAGARDLLQRHRWVREQVRGEIDQLLVDEFQDTDQVQCEIVRLLALEGPGQRPGLFIVGDPKQSIYGWRDADLAAYEAFVEEVLQAGGERFRLAVSYRSGPAILEEVERVVKPVMVEEAGIQPSFQPLVPDRDRQPDAPFRDDRWAAVEHWVSWPKDPESERLDASAKKGKAYELEAKAMAADIVALRSSGEAGWNDMAVLLRATSDLDIVLSAFREAHVPYTVSRDRQYYRRREVVEAAALVRAVVDPGDVLSLLAVLRSDVVGVPDAALIPLWQAGFPLLVMGLSGKDGSRLAAVRRAIRQAAARVPDAPGLDRLPDWASALEAAVVALAELRRSFTTDPVDLFLERLRTLWLAEATAAVRHLGRHRLARLGSFFDDLEMRLLDQELSRAELARTLRRAVEEAQERREQENPPEGEEAVRVMTVHAAKGLDFPHVYLVQLNRDRDRREREATRVSGSRGALHYRLLGWPTLGFLDAERHREAVESAEQVRLLYVAITRAKRRLVLVGQWPADPEEPEHSETTDPEQPAAEPCDPAAATSMMQLVAHRGRGGRLAQLLASGEARRRDEHGVLWVLPALVEATRATTVEKESPPPPPLAELRREAKRLERARELAAARMRRPASTPASAAGSHRLSLEEEATRLEEEDRAARRTAMKVGTRVHRLLERLELDGDLAEQVTAAREALLAELVEQVPAGEAGAARERLSSLLDGLVSGRCLARLAAVSQRVVARELPVLLPPLDDEGPVGFVAGAADLVYRDPDDDRLVVADFKTDLVGSEAEVENRASVYEPQVRLYARALAEALDLDAPPAVELWFLAADRIVRLEGGE